MGILQNAKAKLDAKQIVRDALQETRNELAHIDEIAQLIDDGLSALRDLEGSTVAFNKSARRPGETDLTFNVAPPKGAEIGIKDYGHNGTYISVSNDRIFIVGHGEDNFDGGQGFPSTPEGAKKVLDKASRTAVLYNQIP